MYPITAVSGVRSNIRIRYIYVEVWGFVCIEENIDGLFNLIYSNTMASRSTKMANIIFSFMWIDGLSL